MNKKNEVFQLGKALNLNIVEIGNENATIVICDGHTLENNDNASFKSMYSIEIHPIRSVNKMVCEKMDTYVEKFVFHVGLDEAILRVNVVYSGNH